MTIRLVVSRETLTDGSHAFNGDIYSVDEASPVKTVRLPEQIAFRSEKDATQFADAFHNLFLVHTCDDVEISANY